MGGGRVKWYGFPHDNLLFVLKLKLTKEWLRYKTTGLTNLIFMKFGIKGRGLYYFQNWSFL